MIRNFRNNKKGMSIVISTIIIVAISITMAIAIAFWAMGVGQSFTKFEKLEFVSIYADTPITYPFSTGSQAYANVSISDGGVINSITVTNEGSGYSSLNPPTITFSPPLGAGGTPADVRVQVVNARVISIFVINGGSGYVSPTYVAISPPPRNNLQSFPVYMQIKNTGSAAATINNLFLNGKPYTAYSFLGQSGVQNLVNSGTNSVLNVGLRNNNYRIFLPINPAGPTRDQPWSSGEYVEVEIQTSAGRLYSNTVVLP